MNHSEIMNEFTITETFSNNNKFEYVEKIIVDLLKENGFGILTEIDVKETMKKKLNVEKLPYKILGACNPPRANRILDIEPDLGIFLPCNVILYENEDGTITVTATKPSGIFELIKIKEIESIANEVDEIFSKVLSLAKTKIN